jgi:hypothetical protein
MAGKMGDKSRKNKPQQRAIQAAQIHIVGCIP